MKGNLLKDKKFPAFAIAMLILVVICYFNYKLSSQFVSYTIASIFTALLAIEDINEKKISNILLLAMLGISIVAVALTMNVNIYISSFISGILMFLLMLVMYFISMRNLGFGDVKLMSIIAFLIGFVDAMQLMFMTLVLTVIGGIIICILKKGNLKSEVPMIPYVFAALFVNNVMILAAGR